jgi:nuclear transport factor 2 (NTF2) superfamily protein
MSTSPAVALVPPFTIDTAVKKVRLAEDNWNSRDPNKVVLGYSRQSRWRNRSEFIVGREQIAAFLTGFAPMETRTGNSILMA